MTKDDAMRLLRCHTLAQFADALGLESPQAVSRWPAELNRAQEDRVLGALARQGGDPRRWLREAGQ